MMSLSGFIHKRILQTGGMSAACCGCFYDITIKQILLPSTCKALWWISDIPQIWALLQRSHCESRCVYKSNTKQHIMRCQQNNNGTQRLTVKCRIQVSVGLEVPGRYARCELGTLPASLISLRWIFSSKKMSFFFFLFNHPKLAFGSQCFDL